MNIVSVSSERQMLKTFTSVEEFNTAGSGWMYDPQAKKLWIKMKGGTQEVLELMVSVN